MRKLLVCLMLVPATASAANTLKVGPNQMYAKPCAAITAAQAGDTIEVDAAGSYSDDSCSWSTDGLTVRGVNGRAKIDASGGPLSNGKGIFVISANNATIENMELSGAKVTDLNGAGIRHQGLNLVVRNCLFHDNENGILSGPPTPNTGSMLIENSEFHDNSLDDNGYSHNMYIGQYASFTLRYSWSHHIPGNGDVGHLVKTRAWKNYILYNRITGEDGHESNEINVPQGGTTYIIGNLIEKASTPKNSNFVNYAFDDGVKNGDDHLFVVNNTFVNASGGGTFLLVGPQVMTPVMLVNNIFKGPGTIATQVSAKQMNNFADGMGDPLFLDAPNFDYHLKPGSPCVDKGIDPGMGMGMSLLPTQQYVHPTSAEGRMIAGTAIDIGAYELAGAVSGDGGTTSDSGNPNGDAGNPVGGDAGSGSSSDSPAGCSCDLTSPSPSRGASAIAAGIFFVFWRRRRK